MPKRIKKKSVKKVVAILGVDPGATGAAVALTEKGDIQGTLRFNTATNLDILRFFQKYKGCKALLEQVHSSPQMGKGAIFNFGRGYGKLEMALLAAGVSYEYITPTTWRKLLKLKTKKGGLAAEAKKQRKKDNKAKVEQLFPGIPFKLTIDLVDAILIAEANRRIVTQSN